MDITYTPGLCLLITIFGIDYIKSTYREEIETYPHIASGRLSNGEFRKLPRHLVPSQLGSFAITIDSNAHSDIYFMENVDTYASAGVGQNVSGDVDVIHA